jgi:hypothetical protein
MDSTVRPLQGAGDNNGKVNVIVSQNVNLNALSRPASGTANRIKVASISAATCARACRRTMLQARVHFGDPSVVGILANHEKKNANTFIL